MLTFQRCDSFSYKYIYQFSVQFYLFAPFKLKIPSECGNFTQEKKIYTFIYLFFFFLIQYRCHVTRYSLIKV